ncbi:MAG: protein PhnA [Lysobacterales bacterium]|jgi:protein PhnA
MVRRFEKNQERLQALNLLGKDLARRARSKCELCEAAGVKFSCREIEPVPIEPDLEHCLLLCEQCKQHMDRKGVPDEKYWRCLETAAWKELPVVQVAAVRILRAIDVTWSEQLLDQLYLWPDTEVWLESYD